MKKVFVLVCYSIYLEENVGAEVFASKEDAQKTMKERLQNEKQDLLNSGYENIEEGIDENTAFVLDGEMGYKWEIFESEIK